MRSLLILILVTITGCGSEPPPALELTLYEQSNATPGTGEEHRVLVRVSRSASAFAPRGLRLQAQLRRPAALALLDVDVPLGEPSPTSAPRIAYTEQDASGRVLFSASRAWGRIELSSDGGCPCQTGRLELLLTDPGPDGLLDTRDDQVRRLSGARLRRGDRPFCHARAALEIRPVLVVGSRGCPVRSGGYVAPGSACAWSGAAWIEGWNDDGWYDPGWSGEWTVGWDDGWVEDAWTDWPEEGAFESDTWPADDGWYGQDSWDQGWDEGPGWYEETGSGESWTEDDGWSDDGWSDDGWSDDGWSEDGWSEDGWSDDGWSDDGSDDGSDDWSDW